MNKKNIKKEEIKLSGENVIKKLKELVKQGNIRKIIIKDEKDKTLIEFPLTIGAVGAALLPIWAAIGVVIALVTNYVIIVEKREE